MKNKIKKDISISIAKYSLLMICCLAIFLPVYVVILSSFKTGEEFMYSGIFELPRNFLNLDNYLIFLQKSGILSGFKNITIITAVCMTGQVFMGSMVAYVLDRFDFKLKKVIFTTYITIAIVPSVLTEITRFSLISRMGLFNSIWSVILIYLATDIMQIYIYLQFIGNISKSIDESAMLDGASYFTVFFRIIFPLLSPATATVIILKAINIYNDMYIPFLYMPKRSLKVVTTSLMSFSSENTAQWQLMSAGIVVLFIPTLILYLFLQKYIMSGVTSGSVKG